MKIILAILFQVTGIALYARTGSVSGDNIVIWLPVVIVVFLLLVSFIKKKYKERKSKAPM